MGDVLRFPYQQAQGMAFLERQLRELMSEKGADQPVIDFASQQLTSIYAELRESEQYSFEVALPDHLTAADRESLSDQITTGLEGVRKANHALLIRLVAQLVLAEVKLFQHERDH